MTRPYTLLYKGELIFALRQVDNFVMAWDKEETAKEIYNIIGASLRLHKEDKDLFAYLGLVKDYNGIDIHQARDHIKISGSRRVLVLRLKTVSRPVLTHHRVLLPHLKQKLYSCNLFHARCTKITSCVSVLSVVTKIILITYVSSVICFNGTTNYLIPCLQSPKILAFMFEIQIILSWDFYFFANLTFLDI